MSILSASAFDAAVLSARTLKPRRTASEDSASVTSDSVIAPTPEPIIRTFTSSVEAQPMQHEVLPMYRVHQFSILH